MTLQECKNKVAQDNGWKNWEELYKDYFWDMDRDIEDEEMFDGYINCAMCLWAEEILAQNLKQPVVSSNEGLQSENKKVPEVAVCELHGMDIGIDEDGNENCGYCGKPIKAN